MSYILEALKKSDQERQIGHVPDIAQMQAVPKSAPPRWPRWLLLALLLNAVILVVLAWRTWEARRVSEVVEAPSPAPTATVPAARDQAPVVTPLSSVPPVPASPPVEQEQAVAPMPGPVMQTSQPTVMEEIERMPAPESDSAPYVAEVAPVVTDTAPRWQDLPLEERTNLPAPRIDVHVFAQEPERRFVLINLRKYHAGDTLDDGATLDAILSDGIVLSYGGRQYRVDRP